LIVAMSFLVNCRHILMGAALAPYLRHLPRRRALPALFFMCDESWALALADAQRSAARRVSLPYYMGVSAGLYMAWVSCTAAGAFLG
ncbi:AzlC family ABC transporter permease, partial [Klebsiella pneumoniae]